MNELTNNQEENSKLKIENNFRFFKDSKCPFPKDGDNIKLEDYNSEIDEEELKKEECSYTDDIDLGKIKLLNHSITHNILLISLIYDAFHC